MEKFQVEVKGDEKLIREAHALLLSMGCEFYIDILSTWISQKAKYLIVGSNDGNKFVEWMGFFDSQYGRTISIEKLRDLVAQSKSKEQGLISGEEAKIAWAKGENVEYRDTITWYPLKGSCRLDIFENAGIAFRIKPQKIKLELEIPAPFEPKNGEWYFFLVAENICGYSTDKFEGVERDFYQIQFGAWRTEGEVKIVVEQLRKGLKNA